MGAPTTRRVAALGLWLASGCGSPTSLDVGVTRATGTSTTDADGTGTPSSADTSTTHGSDGPDVPTPDLPDLPPPGACPAACEVELPLVWSWDDAPTGEPTGEPPPDPPDPPGPSRRVTAMAWAPDGTLLVADTRDGQPWLTRSTRDGDVYWAAPFQFTCDCEIAEIGFSGFDQLMVLGEGTDDWGQGWLELTGYFMRPDSIDFVWRESAPIFGTTERAPRVGSLLSLTDGSLIVLTVESGTDVDGLEKDWFEARYYASADPQNLWTLDTQVATAPPRKPLGIALPLDELAFALPGGAGQGDYVVWSRAWYDVVTASQPLPGRIDVMALGPEATLVTAGIDPSEPSGAVLRVASVPRGQPPAWVQTTSVLAPELGAPALAVDAAGSAYVALRTRSGAAGEPEVLLLRLAPDGTPLWTVTLPLPASEAPRPVVLSLAPDDDQDLVLAAIVDGHLHLERREQGCRCD